MQIDEQQIISQHNGRKIVLHYEGDNVFSIIYERENEEIMITLTREELFDINKTVFPNFN